MSHNCNCLVRVKIEKGGGLLSLLHVIIVPIVPMLAGYDTFLPSVEEEAHPMSTTYLVGFDV